MNPDHMREALDLAKQGIALASPNPMVGAIIVQDGNVVGRGSYRYDNVTHAEILALNEAGEKARGATMYVTLEPHAHTGRTPPCTDAIINAGIAKNPGQKAAGSVRFAASGNFAHHEVHPVDNRHRQLARQAEQQPFLDDFFEFVPAVLQRSCICPYSVKTRYGTVVPTLFEQFVLGPAHRGAKVLSDHILVLPDLRGPSVPRTAATTQMR